jgi:gliding motility-associated lipoprotein GldH
VDLVHLQMQVRAMTKIKFIINYILLGFGILLLNACSETPFYNKTFSIQGGVWKQQMRPKFNVKIDDINAKYNFILTVRTTTDYSFSNLWMFLNSKGPKNISGRESFEIKIAKPDGSWIGEKSGSIVENRLLFKQRKLNEKGFYSFELEQGVTLEELKNVIDIGLIIEKIK